MGAASYRDCDSVLTYVDVIPTALGHVQSVG